MAFVRACLRSACEHLEAEALEHDMLERLDQQTAATAKSLATVQTQLARVLAELGKRDGCLRDPVRRRDFHVFLNRVQQTMSGSTASQLSPDTIHWKLFRCSPQRSEHSHSHFKDPILRCEIGFLK